jgi:hypothetical protein
LPPRPDAARNAQIACDTNATTNSHVQQRIVERNRPECLPESESDVYVERRSKSFL